MKNKTAADKFHAHLDVCPQCANNPFGLCAEGARLIQLTAEQGPIRPMEGEKE